MTSLPGRWPSPIPRCSRGQSKSDARRRASRQSKAPATVSRGNAGSPAWMWNRREAPDVPQPARYCQRAGPGEPRHGHGVSSHRSAEQLVRATERCVEVRLVPHGGRLAHGRSLRAACTRSRARPRMVAAIPQCLPVPRPVAGCGPPTGGSVVRGGSVPGWLLWSPLCGGSVGRPRRERSQRARPARCLAASKGAPLVRRLNASPGRVPDGRPPLRGSREGHHGGTSQRMPEVGRGGLILDGHEVDSFGAASSATE